jgi:hypothetical protein
MAIHFLARWSPWPWTLVNGVSALICVAALVRAWRSADRVVLENRRRTRAWRVFVAGGFSLWIGGMLIPVGAIYALVQYKRPSRSRVVAAART